MCENFNWLFEALLEISPFSFLDQNSKNKRNTEKTFNQSTNWGQLTISRGITCIKIGEKEKNFTVKSKNQKNYRFTG